MTLATLQLSPCLLQTTWHWFYTQWSLDLQVCLNKTGVSVRLEEND